MTTISMEDIKKMRTSTGAKIVDCKEALEACAGDQEAAKEWLRKKGIALGMKKNDREASEGVVATRTKGDHAWIAEINCETDFVARSSDFQAFVQDVLDCFQRAVEGGDNAVTSESIKNMPWKQEDGKSITLGDRMLEVSGKLGERIHLNRMAFLKSNPGLVASYTHGAIGPNMGKMGVLVALETSSTGAEVQDLGKTIAMHIAANAPLHLTRQDVPAEEVERERAILKEQIKTSGQSDEIVAKIIEGRLSKFYKDSTLAEQDFVMAPGKSVSAVVEEVAKKIGSPVKIAHFVRYSIA